MMQIRLRRSALALLPLLCVAQPVSAQPAPSQPVAETVATAHPYLTLEQLRGMYTDKQSRFFDVGGLSIHYKDEGPRGAPVLLMVHGSESSLRTWDRITQVLKGRYRIVRFDLPSYGLSQGPTDAAMKALVPTDVPIALLDKLGIKKVTFVGVSSGSTMGMYLAARRPGMVERLILSNSPSDPVDTSHLVLSKGLVDAMDRAKRTGFRDRNFWDEFLSFFSGDPARISAQTRKEYYDFYRRVPEKNLVGLVARIGDGKQAKVEMAKVRQPTLLIWGGTDPLLPASALAAIMHYLSNAQISKVVMPDVGHYPPLEVPDRFAQLIAAYVEAGTPKLPAQ
ncbi:3-oxoadipate enol-lactonase [Novosphingobium sp. Rr 2-17]|uniref:alpha/beta fold hydrolase n=1 Tax=Novosphingobium sp. Rr 2-17 TaxID=555793 RepID=UPI00026984C2|nr:alpha/beta hydrolase [Novosphingobium sp. Rr 2-17]EIZ80505.1 3-oxoadipate enol-lactonase [Novosphingobium sp. Rr 2-17]